MPQAKNMFELVGDKALRRKLEGLSKSGARKVMRPAIRAGLTPIMKKAKSNAPGKYIRTLIKKKVKTSKGQVVGYVEVRGGEDRPVMYQGSLVPFAMVVNVLEFGSAKLGISPRMFMRRARETESAQALRNVTKKANERLDIEWAKADRKGKLL